MNYQKYLIQKRILIESLHLMAQNWRDKVAGKANATEMWKSDKNSPFIMVVSNISAQHQTILIPSEIK